MELVFEIVNTKQFVPMQLCQKTFKQAGGVIGRGRIVTGSFRTASVTCPTITR